MYLSIVWHWDAHCYASKMQTNPVQLCMPYTYVNVHTDVYAL